MNISRRRLADTSKQNIKPYVARASRACSKIIFLHSTNQIIDFWRCCCRFGRRFLNFLLTCCDTTTFLQNLAAKWLWYQVFSRQNDAGLGALSVALWENLVLSVVLHLESKALYLRAFLTEKVRRTWILREEKTDYAWLCFQEKNDFSKNYMIAIIDSIQVRKDMQINISIYMNTDINSINHPLGLSWLNYKINTFCFTLYCFSKNKRKENSSMHQIWLFSVKWICKKTHQITSTMGHKSK